MNLFARAGHGIIRLFSSAAGSVYDFLNPKKWREVWSGGGKMTTSGERVNEQTAMTLPVYYACIRNISEDVGKLPLILYERQNRGKAKATENQLYRILHDAPNEDMGAMEFRELITHWVLGWGNGYAEIKRTAGGDVQGLYPLHPAIVTVGRNDADNRAYQVKNEDGTTRIILGRNMLHIRGIGDRNGGYSICQLMAESLGLTQALQKFGAAFFGNGANAGAVLIHPQTLEGEALKHLRESLDEKHGGADNANKTLILEEGMSYSPIGIPPDHAQFLQSRAFQLDEVCRQFRIPPHKVQNLERATWGNIEWLSIEYVQDTLMPWLTRWEQEINRKLLATEPDLFVEHLVDGILRGDATSRVNFYRGMTSFGGFCINDVMEKENMNGIGPDGDVRFVPLNMVRLEDAAAGLPQNSKTPPPPDGNPPPDPNSPEDVPPADNLPSPPGPRPTKADVAEAFRPVLEAAAAHVLGKEGKAAERAEKKFAKDAASFGKWVDEFYAEHFMSVADELLPAGKAMAALSGLRVWSPMKLVKNHIENSKKELRRLFAEGAVATGFPGYAVEQTKALVAGVISEVTDED